MATAKTPAKTEFPIALTHPDIKDSPIIHAASPSSLKAHEARGWKRAPKSKQPDSTSS